MGYSQCTSIYMDDTESNAGITHGAALGETGGAIDPRLVGSGQLADPALSAAFRDVKLTHAGYPCETTPCPRSCACACYICAVRRKEQDYKIVSAKQEVTEHVNSKTGTKIDETAKNQRFVESELRTRDRGLECPKCGLAFETDPVDGFRMPCAACTSVRVVFRPLAPSVYAAVRMLWYAAVGDGDSRTWHRVESTPLASSGAPAELSPKATNSPSQDTNSQAATNSRGRAHIADAKPGDCPGCQDARSHAGRVDVAMPPKPGPYQVTVSSVSQAPKDQTIPPWNTYRETPSGLDVGQAPLQAPLPTPTQRPEKEGPYAPEKPPGPPGIMREPGVKRPGWRPYLTRDERAWLDAYAATGSVESADAALVAFCERFGC